MYRKQFYFRELYVGIFVVISGEDSDVCCWSDNVGGNRSCRTVAFLFFQYVRFLCTDHFQVKWTRFTFCHAVCSYLLFVVCLCEQVRKPFLLQSQGAVRPGPPVQPAEQFVVGVQRRWHAHFQCGQKGAAAAIQLRGCSLVAGNPTSGIDNQKC